MQKKGLVSLMAVFGSIAMLLTACGGSASTASTSTASASSASSAASTGSGLKGDLTYYSWWNEAENNAQVIKAAIEEYQKDNPDVKITVQFNGRDLRKTLKASLDAGQKIDMWDEADSGVTDYGSHALKLDDYYNKSYPTTDGKTLKDCLLPGFIKTIQSRAEDKTSLLGIPYQPYVMAMFYNKDLFAKAGITEAPKTWDELLAVCDKLKAAGITPATIDDAYMGSTKQFMFTRMFGEDGCAKLSNDSNAWDDPKVLKVAKMMEDFVSKGYFSKQVATNKFPAGQQEMATGNAAIYFTNGTWFPNEVSKTAGENFKWGIFSFPTFDGAVNGSEAAPYGSMAFMVNKDTKSPDAAVNFFVKMVTGKYDTELANKAMNCPISIGGQAPAALADSTPIFQQLTTCWQAPGLDTNADRGTIVASNWQKLLSGSITAEQFVSNCKNMKN